MSRRCGSSRANSRDNFNVQFQLGQCVAGRRRHGRPRAPPSSVRRSWRRWRPGWRARAGSWRASPTRRATPSGRWSELERLLEYDETSIEAVRRFAALAEGAGDDVRLQAAYERLIEIDPFDPIPHQTLGRIAKEAGRTADAVRELEVALALGPVDRVAAHADLAETLFAAGRLAEARRQTLAALEIAPTYDRALELLLTIVEADR